MRFAKPIPAIVCLLLLATGILHAQKSVYGGKTIRSGNHKKNAIKMPRSKAKTICPIFEDTGFPYQGIGFKFGDPVAITYKYYPNKHFAIAADFGRSASGLYSTYYRELFDVEVPDPGDTLKYYSHKVKADWVGDLKLLYHMDGEKISPGLQIYAGVGWELRYLTIQYDYMAQTTPDETKFFDSKVNRFTQGVEAVLGIEYSYFKLPISAFMEMEYYIDVMKDPGWRKLQGGVGIRYVF
jgi:hypothetical protein